ncbi:ABC transporter permease subunit [Sinorhizobium sp. RAC02]|uniref:amino acid ABC transporter permease n=1 Tax=Sinorhizobium sp. RAC02 TaxID=1842534 RepID=UPI00083CEE64|nr:ABC transporter permease subunit [Sinorhizobium sp. RAC02]AOF88247.1 amino ABC transporter, permease, 3-TM region, His/Glu/Gln/Arg/opine family domain protein [Sinorhizobium sp. RAC02]
MAFLHDMRFRAYFYQVVAVGFVVLIGWTMFATASGNLAKQNIATGFDFLTRPAGFVITEAAIAFEATDTVGRAILVGIANTVKVSLLAAFFGTLLGLAVGIARMSRNPLLARLALIYVELLRNVPLLLYLFLWYSLIILILPPVKQALNLLPGVYLSNSGLVVPAAVVQSGGAALFACLVGGAAVALFIRTMATRKRIATGQSNHGGLIAIAVFLAPVLLLWFTGGFAVDWDFPTAGKFRLTGGLHVRPEFVALLFGLALSVSANVAEIVRAGIQAVDKGQWEASAALGLARGKTMRLVVLPQALRIIIPPLTNTYLTVFKNSSLAIAIGYPDLVMVSNTVMNQTGQAIETIAIFMGVYLALSITISLVMNWYNAHVALKER